MIPVIKVTGLVLLECAAECYAQGGTQNFTLNGLSVKNLNNLLNRRKST